MDIPMERNTVIAPMDAPMAQNFPHIIWRIFPRHFPSFINVNMIFTLCYEIVVCGFHIYLTYWRPQKAQYWEQNMTNWILTIHLLCALLMTIWFQGRFNWIDHATWWFNIFLIRLAASTIWVFWLEAFDYTFIVL